MRDRDRQEACLAESDGEEDSQVRPRTTSQKADNEEVAPLSQAPVAVPPSLPDGIRPTQSTLDERIAVFAESQQRRKIIFKRLRRIFAENENIVFGPFAGEIGFEVLYWIPFLHYLTNSMSVKGNKFFFVSRGGADDWYAHLGGRYLDLLDIYEHQKYRDWNQGRIKEFGVKQLVPNHYEEEVVALAAECFNISKYGVISPSHMFSMVDFFQPGVRPKFLSYQYFSSVEHKPGAFQHLVKDSFVAVKFWRGGQFRITKETQKNIIMLIARLAEETSVILLNPRSHMEPNPLIDVFFDSLETTSKNIYHLRELSVPRTNLRDQSYFIQNAAAFFGTYGGVAYLPPFLGTDSVSFYENERNFFNGHLLLMYQALRELLDRYPETTRSPDFSVLHADRLGHRFGLPGSALIGAGRGEG